VSTVIWVTCFAISFASEYVALAPKVRSNAVSFDDLIPRYKPCWDYRTTLVPVVGMQNSNALNIPLR